MKTEKPPFNARLMGKAGLGLAMFHFGRLGHEFALTSENSHAGDMWVDFGEGPEVVEVKATRLPRWGLRKAQAARVRWFVLVNITDADCWLISASALLSARGGTAAEGFIVTGRDAIKMGARGLHHEASAMSRAAKVPVKRGSSSRIQRVKKRLASGEVKVYEYVR